MSRRLLLMFAAVCVLPGTLTAQEPSKAPAFPVAELRDYVPKLARAIELIGLNQAEEALDALEVQTNPGLPPEGVEKFKESWMKLFVPIGRMKLQFESLDVVAVDRVSTQAYEIYGIANGIRGPVHFDFRVYRYRSRWMVEGFHFRMSWDRDRVIRESATRFPVPVTYSFAPQGPIARAAGLPGEPVAAVRDR